MKIWICILVVMLMASCSTISALADSTSNSLSLSLPNSGTNYQSDSFRSGDLDCTNAIGSATNIEFGLTSIIQGGTAENSGKTGDIGIYSKITIPLGKRAKSRIDCNRLYELELQKKQLEVMKLQQEINKLRELAFE
jgi:hypothetical protein|tara:strand:+ start:317 stop:727 length:411 start_codon:yes stop_codon:yes gene_type:complete